MTLTAPSEALSSDLPLASVMNAPTRYRAHHWDALVRTVLSVTAAHLDAQGRVDWSRVTAGSPQPPVTEDDLRAWLTTKPPHAAMEALSWLVDARDPRAVTREALVQMTATLHPDGLLALLPSSVAHDRRAQALYLAAGDVYGEACGRALVATPYRSFAEAMAVCSDGACAAYLRAGAPVMGAHDFGQVGNRILERGAVSEAVRAAYGEALVGVVERLPNKQASSLYVFVALAHAEALTAALRAATKRPKVWARLCALLAAQGYPQGATALAAMLDHKTLADHAAAALATMGAVGVAATQAWLDAHGTKNARGAEVAQRLLAVPSCEGTMWDGERLSLPRFGRTAKDDVRSPPPSSGAVVHAPTPLAALEAVIAEKPAADMLPPEGWADLLQIVRLDPHLTNVPWAWARANAEGLLGRGADAATMMAALDDMRWDCAVTRAHTSPRPGVGHLLLWAGASREVYQHAIARFEESAVSVPLGERGRHFLDALSLVQPRWAPTMQCLVRYYEADHNDTVWQGPPPVLARCTTPAPSMELPAPTADLWITGHVQGATRFTLRFRGNITVTVDVERERWEVKGAEKLQGATPPLDATRGVRFTVETARDLMFLGIDGAAVHKAIEKVPAKVAPVTVTAEGDGAVVTELTLHAKYTVRATDAVGTLLLDLDDAQGYTEVAGLKTPAAARTLAACAVLLDEARAAHAKTALLTMKGEGLDAWQALARDGVTVTAPVAEAPKTKGRKKKADEPDASAPTLAAPPPTPEAPTSFTVRSYEDIVRAVHDLKLGVKARSKKPAVFKRGQTEHGDLEYASWGPAPEKEDWGARSAVPWPAVYLGNEAPPFNEPKYFLSAIADLPAVCQKGRGTMARMSYVLEKGHYVLASLLVTPPDDGHSWDEWRVAAAAWKVDEGWAWAVLEGDAAALLPLVNMRALPPQVSWKEHRGALGDW